MHLSRSNLLFVFTYIYMTVVIKVSCESTDDRNSKHFSLFSVVTFQNTECTSSTSLSGGATDGTCYTNTECTDKGGTTSGNCASGFGVCCVFLNILSATSTITENRTRIRNSEFPSTDVSTTNGVIVYTINKVSSDICQLRLDFDTFVIGGPGNSQELIGTLLGTHCVDSLQIITTDSLAWSQTPTASLCGALTGEHVYIDLSTTSTDTATLTLAINGATLAAATALRSWDIKTSQIECYATYRAPIGCQRYMTEDYGKIISYNFYRVTGAPAQGATPNQNSGVELGLQRINTCIRRSKNMCCVEYKLCAAYNGIALADVATGANILAIADEGDNIVYNEAWSIDTNLSPYLEDTEQGNLGLVDSQCTGDYVEIQSSWSAACGAGTSSMRTIINSRYCGVRLGYHGQASAAIGASAPVCDCSEPFVVRHSTDDANDTGGHNSLNLANTGKGIPRGFCLDYQQMPCWQ